MKSSIFDGDPLGPRRARKPVPSRQKLKPLFNRKAQSASPYPHSSSVFSPKPSPNLDATSYKTHKSTPNRSQAALPSTVLTVGWNLDEMVAKYHENGLLPTPLSPSLPHALSDASSKKRQDKETKSQHSKTELLRGTKKTAHDQFASPKVSPESSDAPDSDVDNISLLMLLPTLPSMFDKQVASERYSERHIHTCEKSDFLSNSEKKHISKLQRPIKDTPNSSGSNISSSNVKILTSNPSKYVVRISYRPRSYKKLQLTSTRPIAGLGLSLDTEAGLLVTTSEPTLSEEVQKLLSRKNYWYQSASETKQKSKELESIPEKRLMSVVVRFDSILLFIILYDFEEKYAQQSKTIPSERSWLLLIDDCRELIKNISVIHDLGPYMSNLTGVLRFMIAMAYKRINGTIDEVVSRFKQKLANSKPPSLEIATKIMEYQETQIKNYKRMQYEFENAQTKIVMFGKYFPKTWGLKMLEPKSRNHKSVDMESLAPASASFYLPIGVYSDLQEVSGFMYSCVRELLEILLQDQHKKCIYLLKSGLNNNKK